MGAMYAAQLVAPGRFEVVEVPTPEPGPGEVLVGMARASICGSDLHAVAGGETAPSQLAPGAPGHEGVGIVVASQAEAVAVGTAVLTVPLPGSGRCFADYQVVGGDFLVALPKGGDLGRLLLAQQLGTAVFAFRRYWPAGRDAAGACVAIAGAGSAGLFLLQLARLAGFTRAVVCDLEPTRLEVATALGADVAVLAPDASFVEAVRSATGGRGADLVIEATGRDARRADAVEAACQGGRVGFFGLPEGPDPAPFPFARAFRRAVSLELAGQAQLEPGLEAFREAVRLIAEGELDVGHLLEPVYPLQAFPEAFAAATARRGVKVSVLLGGAAPA